MNELLVARLRPHGRRLVLPVLALLVAACGLGFATGGFGSPAGLALGLGGLVVLALAGGVWPLLVWLRTRYVITTRRVVVARGVFTVHETEMELAEVVDVATRRGPLQSLFGSGSIDLTAVTGRRLRLNDVPETSLVADSLRELATARRAAR